MPSNEERTIASTALQLWDMGAEDADGSEELWDQVAEGLVEHHGLDIRRAREVARMADAALNRRDHDPASGQDFKADPIYVALREEVDTGSWDTEEGFE